MHSWRLSLLLIYRTGLLQTAVIQFLATWRGPAYATISDLRADPIIAGIVDELLPQSLTFVEWLGRRMRRDIELNGDSDAAIVHVTQHGRSLVVRAYDQISSVGSHRAATRSPPEVSADA